MIILHLPKHKKEQLYSIISSWYEEKFERAKGLKLESFEGMPIASFDTKLVECDEKKDDFSYI